MTKQNNIIRELREAEALESALTRLFASLQPPYGAAQRLLAKIDGAFHESQLTLDDDGPFSFEQAAAERDAASGSDLLAAGLEESEIDPVQDDESDEQR